MNPIKEMEVKLRASKDNVRDLKKLVAGWVSYPLFERKDGKKDQLLCLDKQADERKDKRYREIKEVSGKIKDLVAKNRDLLYDETADPDDEKQAWKDYLGYLDNFVIEGLVKTIAVR